MTVAGLIAAILVGGSFGWVFVAIVEDWWPDE